MDAGALVNTDIGGNGSYSASFTATSYTHQFRIWGQAYTVTSAQVNFTNPSVKITTASDLVTTGDTQSLNPPSLNIGTGSPSEYTQSDISEILVYNGTLSKNDHSKINSYIKNKWGL